MQRQELRALGELAGDALGGLTMRIEEMHTGIAARAPRSILHDRIAAGTYGAVRVALRSAVRGGVRLASLTRTDEEESVQRSLRGRVAIGALNGIYGDRLREPLASEMIVARPITAPTPKLAVFLHGLCETEDAWWLGASRHPPYGQRLENELGWTSIYIRYNSGRQVSDSGRALAHLLDELADAWPVEVEEIALIGHSMGGLVARCACHEGAQQPWISRVRHVFMLGTPHRGAPLAKAATAAEAALALLPETQPLATALNLSAGIRDLCDACGIPFLPTANQYFVSATVSRDAAAPVGRLIGDLLVLPASAWDHGGRGQRLMFALDNYRHVGGANHFDLLNHPAIYAQISRWLSREALPAPLS